MATPPDLESLRLLVLVGRRGSLGGAAAETGVSQPAASKRMRALERRLGVQLVERSRRGSTLTTAGELVAARAERVLDELRALQDGVELLRLQASAPLVVAASLTVAEHLLPSWIAQLTRSDPGARVGLQVMNSSLVCAAVRDGDASLGFVESPGMLPGLRSRVVGRDRLTLVVDPGHPWSRRRRPVEPAELAGTPLLSREPGSGTRETVERALAAAGHRAVEPLLELGSSTALRSAVRSGAGPALLSEFVVADDRVTGALVEVAVSGLDLHRELRAVWRSAEQPSGTAAALLRHALRGR
ncbi:DNA-binding transcriptional regulator, LysR family [Pseudonocardia ammonioxydans]|uniref:DNA-binding transcriptional regulator, LysR family n=1 Tax=Pseudonocardia ammonioxydans TaxID=260086 RepID=A0A1I4Z7R1_PSUAM|nr:LysR substrate-binding domain-containing protein [Pseudonocardia ammonioxydans]SFN46306.1 DNA-binding transcriptional regulator, LysR family [Pseudonocardia ammonioxydans]